jgi:hypothetical protein
VEVLRVVHKALKHPAGNPVLDVHDRGGRIIPDLVFTNFYLGGKSSWKATDVASIDGAVAAAMSDVHLNNVMVQYFRGSPVTSEFRPSRVLPGKPPKRTGDTKIASLIKKLRDNGDLDGYPLANTVFNFVAPKGTVIRLDGDSSQTGMAGFHNAVPFGKKRIYYSLTAYSQGKNGIVVFKQAWKNVVATIYHELNEARTDPDVYDAGVSSDDSYLGWTNDQLPGEEIGDIPFVGHTLKDIIKEVPLATGGTVPIQLMWSNYVHGPEGPVTHPRPPTS